MTDIWVLTWSHRHGLDKSVFATFEGAEQYRREIAAENWDEEIRDRISRPTDPEKCADAYFEFMGDQPFRAESCTIERHTTRP